MHKQHEIYMAKARILHGDPTPPIFHLLALGVGVRDNTNFSIFRYQHVGIPNMKLWRLGSKPMRGPNANGFIVAVEYRLNA